MAKEKRNRWMATRGILILIALLTLVVVLTFFFGDSGLLEIVRSQRQIEALEKDIRELEQQRDRLQKEIEALQRDPLALEREAREKLWLMKKNEKVVVIIDRDKNRDPGED